MAIITFQSQNPLGFLVLKVSQASFLQFVPKCKEFIEQEFVQTETACLCACALMFKCTYHLRWPIRIWLFGTWLSTNCWHGNVSHELYGTSSKLI